ncbi:hypothetical protein [Labrys sp. ZIDIC5]|uniref:hypothetical protein n=1 Tax=Labrys sedimenti TaxID=3106036 RepID=UPI002ACAC195|nr:hypothetical protein [Labrys sp. ZIDIC5]MDZ5448929.1 hypothetical protein [Labrys sp. ZIDIC5]
MSDEERDVMKSMIEANAAAIEVLVLCLERNGVLERGQYPEALREHMDLNVQKMSPMALALLADIRESLLH